MAVFYGGSRSGIDKKAEDIHDTKIWAMKENKPSGRQS
jgi:hypothetical protein